MVHYACSRKKNNTAGEFIVVPPLLPTQESNLGKTKQNKQSKNNKEMEATGYLSSFFVYKMPELSTNSLRIAQMIEKLGTTYIES